MDVTGGDVSPSLTLCVIDAYCLTEARQSIFVLVHSHVGAAQGKPGVWMVVIGLSGIFEGLSGFFEFVGLEVMPSKRSHRSRVSPFTEFPGLFIQGNAPIVTLKISQHTQKPWSFSILFKTALSKSHRFFLIAPGDEPINALFLHSHGLVQVDCGHDHPQLHVLACQQLDVVHLRVVRSREEVIHIFFCL